jgi:hypothetical protein
MIAGLRRGKLWVGLLATLFLLGSSLLLSAASALAAPPANDDFAAAQAISALPLSVSGTNVEATKEAEEPTPHAGGGFAGHSVWYSWQAPSTTVVTIGTCGSDFDAALAVFTGNALNALTLVESNTFSFGPGCSYGYRSEVTFKAFAGTTYRVVVDGAYVEWASKEQEEAFPPIVPEGEIELTIAVTPPPANDDFAQPQPLDVGAKSASTTVWGGNWGATRESGEPDHADVVGGASIWYSWTPPHSGATNAVGCAGQIAVYTGAAVGALTPVATDAGYGGPCPVVFFWAQAGTTYRIALDAAYDATKGYVPMGATYMILRERPENDDFEDAVTLSSATHVDYSEQTGEATKQAGEPDHAGNGGGRSVWFTWTAPESATFELNTCGSVFDTLLGVYTGASLFDLTQVASNDNANGPTCPDDERSELSFEATAGVTYHFAVDGHDGAYGPLRLILNRPHLRPPLPVAPITRIRGRWVNRARRTAMFTFTARAGSAPVGSFTCRLDGNPPAPCRRRKTYRHLRMGHHTFVVWATDVNGVADSRAPRVEFWIPKSRHRR